ncbi:methionine ABC transporter substrate-binding protein, partial [Campylobacter coli]|nr:methionine ABC transporter substrate-binding protein [Campylobacter coli]
LDANLYQHKPFLEDFNAHKGTKLSSLGSIVLVPMAIYSNDIKDIKNIPNGAKIAIPNDATNESRALDLLAKAGLIEFKTSSTLKTPIDISKNPKNLKFIELKAAQLPRALNDVDLAVITTNYALGAGLNPLKDGIFIEDKDSLYAIVLAVRQGDEKNEKSLILKEILTSDKIKNFINEQYKGSVIPTF